MRRSGCACGVGGAAGWGVCLGQLKKGGVRCNHLGDYGQNNYAYGNEYWKQ